MVEIPLGELVDTSSKQYEYGYRAGKGGRSINTGDTDLDNIFEKCVGILQTKGKDYSDDNDRLSNFKIIAEAIGITPLQVLAVFMMKHDIAVSNYIKRGKLESEPIEGRIADGMNYRALLYKMIVEAARARFMEGPPK